MAIEVTYKEIEPVMAEMCAIQDAQHITLQEIEDMLWECEGAGISLAQAKQLKWVVANWLETKGLAVFSGQIAPIDTPNPRKP